MTDKFNRLFSTLVGAVSRYAKLGSGLPITVVNTVAVAATSSTQLTITMPTDAWVSGIYPTVLTTAGVAVQDAWCDSIDIAGFRIYDMQGALGPIFNPAAVNSIPQTAQTFHGYPHQFRVRQGDTITITFTSLNAAILRGTAYIDAYRVDHLEPA